MASRNHFKGKRITIIGLGIRREMIEDAKFLIKSGALVSVYDLKSEARIKEELVYLRSIGLANYVCGSIPADDLLDSDLIILSHEYPRNSSFLDKAKEKGIPIEYPETLFFKLAPPLTVVGVVGAAGKSSVLSVLEPMLEMAVEQEKKVKEEGQDFFVIDPESDRGVLPHLKKIENGDILLIRIIPRLMNELHAMRISPHVAIFTGMPHPLSYGKSPFEILEHQTYNNFLIASDEVIDVTRSYEFKPRAKMLRTKPTILPPIWDVNLHAHDKMNVSLALQAAKLFHVDDDKAQSIIENWQRLRGRMEFVKKIKGVDFYNDAASVMPESTILALKTISKNRNTVLICGGSDTGLDYSEFCRIVPEYVHTLVLIPGSGTLKQRKNLAKMENISVLAAPGFDEAVRLARENAKNGDIVLFSPAFEAAGLDSSREVRSERFLRAVRLL